MGPRLNRGEQRHGTAMAHMMSQAVASETMVKDGPSVAARRRTGGATSKGQGQLGMKMSFLVHFKGCNVFSIPIFSIDTQEFGPPSRMECVVVVDVSTWLTKPGRWPRVQSK